MDGNRADAQAGIALGMALVGIVHRTDLGEIILPVIIASTVLFELIGPVLIRTGLIHAREVLYDRTVKQV
ncbi:MAG: hypothetical protein ACQEQO_10470 [Thermodesulfobacteriota bacterium]